MRHFTPLEVACTVADAVHSDMGDAGFTQEVADKSSPKGLSAMEGTFERGGTDTKQACGQCSACCNYLACFVAAA